MAISVRERWTYDPRICLHLPFYRMRIGRAQPQYEASELSGWSGKVTYSRNRLLKSTNLADFPMHVKLRYGDARDREVIESCQSGGEDLRFYNESGALLSHEIDTWDSTGDCFVHVKMPSLPAHAVTRLIMHYGNPITPDGQNAADVWSNGFAAVYHMNDLTASTIKDSLGVNNGTKVVGKEPIEVDGLVGKAQYFDGTGKQILLANPIAIPTAFTIEAIYKRLGANSDNSLHMIITRTNGHVYTTNCYINPTGIYTVGSIYQPTQITTYESVTKPADYNHVGNIYTGSKYYSFANGVVSATKDAGALEGGTSQPRIGARYAGDTYFANGLIDEIRVSSVVRSAEWIAETSKTLKTPEDYFIAPQSHDFSHYGHIIYPEGMTPAKDYWSGDGVDDLLSFGTVQPLGTGDISIMGWMYLKGWGVENAGIILDNGKIYLGVQNNYLRFSSDYLTHTTISAAGSLALERWIHFCVTRTAAGLVNFYIDGLPSGLPNQNSGTPAASTTNFCIGNRIAGDRAFNGYFRELTAWNGILTIQQARMHMKTTKWWA